MQGRKRAIASVDQDLGTRDRLLEAAIALMRRAGFSAAGINEIVKESGAPKGSVYHFFPQGKRQIVREALARYSERIVAAFDEALSSKTRPRDKIRALFRALARRLEAGDFRLSCAAGAVSLDLDEDLEVVRVEIAQAFAAWRDLIGRHFPIADRRRRESFAGLVLTAIEGGYIRGRAEHSTQPFKDAATWLAEVAEAEVRRGS
jgi:TetR/AcrR family transcriptional repressor of lmrAB and yxaGH operons